MRLSANSGLRGKIIDLDENREVLKVLWVDIDQGLVEAYETDSRGRVVYRNGKPVKYMARGRFSFVPNNIQLPMNVILGAPQCAICRNPLTLQGDDLCPGCRAKERNQRHPMRVEKLSLPFLDRKCQHKGCSRLAQYSVGDEVEVTPQLGMYGPRKAFYERGATVDRRYYCAFHFVPPRILDSKGEVIEVLEEAEGVRPQ